MMPPRTIRVPSTSVPAIPSGSGGPRVPLTAPPPPRRPPLFGATGAAARPSSAHPLMVPMYWACADVLGLVPELAAARGSLPSAGELRATLEQQLSAMMKRATDAGIVPDDVIE